MYQHEVSVSLLQGLAEKRQIDLDLRKLAVHVGDGLRWLVRVVSLLLLLGLMLLVVDLEYLTVEEDKHVLDLSLRIRQLDNHGVAEEELVAHVVEQRVDVAELEA